MSYKWFDRKIRGLPLEEEEKPKNIWDDSVSIQQEEIVLDDGRMVDAELWSESGITFLTYTMENTGFEDSTKEEILDYYNQQGITISKESYDEFDLLIKGNKIKLTMKIGEM